MLSVLVFVVVVMVFFASGPPPPPPNKPKSTTKNEQHILWFWPDPIHDASLNGHWSVLFVSASQVLSSHQFVPVLCTRLVCSPWLNIKGNGNQIIRRLRRKEFVQMLFSFPCNWPRCAYLPVLFQAPPPLCNPQALVFTRLISNNNARMHTAGVCW